MNRATERFGSIGPLVNSTAIKANSRETKRGRILTEAQKGFLILVGIVLLISIGLAASDIGGEEKTTLEVAAKNSTYDYITEINLYIDGELKKSVPIYNGYWADFGTYKVKAGKHTTKVSVNYYEASTFTSTWEQTPVKTETIGPETKNFEGGSIYESAFEITKYGINTVEYPEATTDPVSAND